jgi:8-oxo-dGTP pyrophosphatase MutT (NUDIX family)
MAVTAPLPSLNEAVVREPLRARLATRSLQKPPHGIGRASAVLVPLFEDAGDVLVWLVRRAEGLRTHGGQIAFPGGKSDPADASPLATALREAHEEIGLVPDTVDVLGRLEDFHTITGFAIAPFVGWLPREPVLPGNPREAWQPVPNPAEVARVFAAPLRAFVAAPRGVPPLGGYQVEGEFVWGATAKMLNELALVVAEIAAPGARRQ